MSAKRTVADVAVEQREVWPRRFWDETPTLGWTPTLPDEENEKLARTARKAVSKAFGAATPAPEADPPTSV